MRLEPRQHLVESSCLSVLDLLILILTNDSKTCEDISQEQGRDGIEPTMWYTIIYLDIMLDVIRLEARPAVFQDILWKQLVVF